jgi:hypothetical protein
MITDADSSSVPVNFHPLMWCRVMQSIQHSCNTLKQTPVRLQILQGTHRQETKKILTSPQTICLKFMIMCNDTDITGTLNHPNEQQCNVGKKHKTPRKKHAYECAHTHRGTHIFLFQNATSTKTPSNPNYEDTSSTNSRRKYYMYPLHICKMIGWQAN